MLNLDYRNIKEEARMYLSRNKMTMIYIAVVIALLSNLPSAFSNSSAKFIGGILGILFIPVPHGLVTSSLKMITGQENTIDVQNESLTGFNRFGDLFITYLLQRLAVYVPFIIIVAIGMAVVFGGVGLAMMTDGFGFAPGSIVMFLLIVLVAIAYAFYATVCLSFTGYVLETKGLRGMDAVKESYNMIRGHVWDLIKLYLSYILWMILAAFIEYVLSRTLLSSTGFIGNAITTVVAAFVSGYFYSAELQIGVAIFYMRIYNHQLGLDRPNDYPSEEAHAFNDSNVYEGEAVHEEAYTEEKEIVTGEAVDDQRGEYHEGV